MKQVNIRVPEKERRRLENYAADESRSVTDILREFIRSLPDRDPPKVEQTANATR
jgi:predicted DNA-binding protein